MKRDPVLAQLDALINGITHTPQTSPKAARTEVSKTPHPPPHPFSPPPLLVPQDPVLSQLDALINPGANTAPLVHFATPVALVLPQSQPPPLLAPPALLALPEPEPIVCGPPGILREFGGVKGWMALLQRANAHDTARSANALEVGLQVDAVAAPDDRFRLGP